MTTATAIVYRLRIRNASTVLNPNGTTDDLVVTSVRGGTNPYLGAAPSGDGQEVDPLTGSVRTGSYTVEIIDAVTGQSGGTNDRVLTKKLFDSVGRQQMLSRRAYVEISTDNGGAWSSLIAGYILGYVLTDALTWSVSIGDTRRVEENTVVFDGSSASFAKRGCLLGGPILGGWGPVPDRGGWKFRVRKIDAVGGGASIVYYTFVSGYKGINDPLTTNLDIAIGKKPDSTTNWVQDKAQPFYSPSTSPYAWGGFPGLTGFVSELAGGATHGLFTPGGSNIPVGPMTMLITSIPRSYSSSVAWGMFSLIFPSGIALPSVGDIHTISVYATKACDTSPIYLTEHPVDIITKLWTDAQVSYSAAAAAAAKALLGDTMRVSMRITKSMSMLEFLEDHVYAPFGLAARTNSSGEQEIFLTRLRQSAVPSVTINTNDLPGAEEPIFGNQEQSIITAVRYKTKVYWNYIPDTNDTSDHPLDSVFETDNEVLVQNGNIAAYNNKEISYEIPGFIHDVAGIAQNMDAFVTAIAREVFDRFGSGAPEGELAVLRSADTGFQIGDEIYLQPAHLPNLNKRLGDDPSVGARIVQLVRRTETPSGPLLKYVDAGSDQQPVVPAAVITIAANAVQPRILAEFTVTNAAAINATAVLTTAVQWATGAASPANGVPFNRYAPGTTPVGATQLPPVTPGTKVWVRARTEQDGRRPSAWSAWTSVTLTAITAPSALTFTSIRQNGAIFNWTNGSATDMVDVFAYPGSSDPADWTPYFVCTLPPGSTRINVRNLLGPTIAYRGAVKHRDPNTGKQSAAASAGFTTNSTLDAATRPAGIAIIPTVTNAALQTGVALALFASDVSFDIVIERAPDSGGSPGTFAVIAQVRGATQTYLDVLPNDGATYWYRIKHALSSYADSTYTCNKSATPTALPPTVTRPDAVPPIIAMSTFETQGVAVGTMELTITDPQCRVDIVAARTKVDPGAWTGFFGIVPVGSVYTQTVNIPILGFGWINMVVYGWNAQGVYGLLFDETVAFDRDTVPSIVTLEGSFLDNGTLLIRATADSDTQSIYCAVSTGGYPSDATVLATSPVNGRNVEFSFAGAYAIGTRVYVSCIGAASTGGAGALSPTFQLSIIRGNDAANKTTRIAAAGLMRCAAPAANPSFLPISDENSGYVHWDASAVNTGAGIIALNQDIAASGVLPVPKGGTLTAARTQVWANGGGGVGLETRMKFRLDRVEDSGTVTQLGSTQTTTTSGAWETLAVSSLSESTSGARSYRVTTLGDAAGALNNHDLRTMWIEYDFTAPNYNVTT